VSTLDQSIENDAGLIHRSPQPVLHSGDLEGDLIEMPFVADAREATTDSVGELLAEFARPLLHGFVADDDAAGGQQLLYHTQPEREPEIQPDRRVRRLLRCMSLFMARGRSWRRGKASSALPL
jgi:hypothetical protein